MESRATRRLLYFIAVIFVSIPALAGEKSRIETTTKQYQYLRKRLQTEPVQSSHPQLLRAEVVREAAKRLRSSLCEQRLADKSFRSKSDLGYAAWTQASVVFSTLFTRSSSVDLTTRLLAHIKEKNPDVRDSLFWAAMTVFSAALQDQRLPKRLLRLDDVQWAISALADHFSHGRNNAKALEPEAHKTQSLVEKFERKRADAETTAQALLRDEFFLTGIGYSDALKLFDLENSPRFSKLAPLIIAYADARLHFFFNANAQASQWYLIESGRALFKDKD